MISVVVGHDDSLYAYRWISDYPVYDRAISRPDINDECTIRRGPNNSGVALSDIPEVDN